MEEQDQGQAGEEGKTNGFKEVSREDAFLQAYNNACKAVAENTKVLCEAGMPGSEAGKVALDVLRIVSKVDVE